MNDTKPTAKALVSDKKRNEWFGNLIHLITTDKDFLNLGIASEETEGFYNKIIGGDPNSISFELREKLGEYFIGKLVVDYMKELFASKVDLSDYKIYLNYNNSQLLVWAEINDDDENAERTLLKAEAKANALNYKYGFHISSTILEKCDKMQVPPQYQPLTINTNVATVRRSSKTSI